MRGDDPGFLTQEEEEEEAKLHKITSGSNRLKLHKV